MRGGTAWGPPRPDRLLHGGTPKVFYFIILTSPTSPGIRGGFENVSASGQGRRDDGRGIAVTGPQFPNT